MAARPYGRCCDEMLANVAEAASQNPERAGILCWRASGEARFWWWW